MSSMPALTLWQPWASLIALEVKSIETRSWPAPAKLIGERIAIHAAATSQGFYALPGDCEGNEEAGWRYGYVGDFQAAYCHRTSDEGTRGEAFVHDLSPDGPSEPTWVPLGAVVATARLAACVPMVEREWVPEGFVGTREDVLAVLPPGHPYAPEIHLWTGGQFDSNVSDQLPFGHFEPGRWAWLLEDVEQLPEAVPARGRQKVWRWTP